VIIIRMPARRAKVRNDEFLGKIRGGVKKQRRIVVTPHEDETHRVKMILDHNPHDRNQPYLFRSEYGDEPWWGWLHDLLPRAKINDRRIWNLAYPFAINIFRSSNQDHPTYIKGNMSEITEGRTCSNQECFHKKSDSPCLYAAHVWVYVSNKQKTEHIWIAGITPLCGSCNKSSEPIKLKQNTSVNIIERVVTFDNNAFINHKYDVELNVSFPKTEDKGIRFGKYIVNTRLTQSFKPKLEF
jgi:hypothetical protein